MRESLTLYNPQHAGEPVRGLLMTVKAWLVAGHRVTLEAKTDTRSLEQNRLMWSCLRDLSEQVTWPDGRRMTPTGWKDYLTGHLSGQEMFPNMDGTGFIIVGKGRGTSEMTIAEMVDVINLAHLFGDARSVRWKQTSLGRDWPMEIAA